MSGTALLDEATVATRLPWAALIRSIDDILRDPTASGPQRAVHLIERPDASPLSLLVKPAWSIGATVAVKVVTVVDDNSSRGLPGVNAGVMLFDAIDGRLLGLAAGNELTTRRTAAASALAARRLVRTDAQRLLVVGTGALAPRLAEAHAHVHDYASIEIWGRRPERAREVSADLATHGLRAVATDDLQIAVARADVITCGTASTEPLVLGMDVQPGTHVDLVGSYSPATRESDDELIANSSVWLDHLDDAALSGDIRSPLDNGRIMRSDIVGDLSQLVRGEVRGRSSDDEVTVFKSSGMAIEDLAAMRLAVDS